MVITLNNVTNSPRADIDRMAPSHLRFNVATSPILPTDHYVS